NLGGVAVATKFTELEQLIKQYLKEPTHNLAQRKLALEQECFKPDGQATDRVVAAVVEIFNNTKENTK
ncbi:MAG: hypothetical protein AAGA31_10570, partial [Bacteroidota bacterium]